MGFKTARIKSSVALMLLFTALLFMQASFVSAKPYLIEHQLGVQGLEMISEINEEGYWAPQFNASYDNISLTICNVPSESFPMFHAAEKVYLMTNQAPCDEGDEFPSTNIMIRGQFDGIKFLPNISISAAVSLEYMPVSYQTGTYDEMWNSDPYLEDNKLHLFNGSGNMIQNTINITDSNVDTNKFVGFGELTGVFDFTTSADEANLVSSVHGVGYADFYAQYAEDDYDGNAFIDSYSHCEHLALDTTATPTSGNYNSRFIGVFDGMKPLPISDADIIESYSLEYMPVSYQTGTYDYKWIIDPVLSDDGTMLYLLSGSGTVKKLDVRFEDNNPSTPKIVGFSKAVGVFDMGADVADGGIQFGINGVGALMNETYPSGTCRWNACGGGCEICAGGLGIQYAPNDSYKNTTFVDSYYRCEYLGINTNANPSESDYASSFIGVFDGMKPLPISDVSITESYSLEYMPISYQTGTYDQKWNVEPSFDGKKLRLFSGSGNLISSVVKINDSNEDTNKFVGFGELTGVFDFTTSADEANMVSSVHGVGYADFYAQYAEDDYDGNAFIDSYSHCEHLALDTTATPTSGNYNSRFIGVFDGMKPLPISDVSITEAYSFEYMPISYQTGTYDQKWDVEPSFEDNKLHLFNGSGNIIQNTINITDNNIDTNKFVGFGELTGVFDFTTSADEANLVSSVHGVGYADFYAQYAEDDYDGNAFIDSYSHCEHLALDTKATPTDGNYNSKFIGVFDGMKPLPISDADIIESYSLEYMPVSYQTGTYDQKWDVNPYLDNNTMYLLRGAGNIEKVHVTFEDHSPDTKITGFGEAVGTFRSRADITDNAIQFSINGIGALMNSSGIWPDYTGGLGIDYAPEGYDNHTFIDSYSHCERLSVDTKATPASGEWSSLFVGVFDGAKPLPFSDITLNESFEAEYYPIGNCFDSKWFVNPSEHDGFMAIISNGTGTLNMHKLQITDSNSETGTIEGIDGISDAYVVYNSDNLTWLDTDVHGYRVAVNPTTGFGIKYGA